MMPLLPKLVSPAASGRRSTSATVRPRAWSASAAETPTIPAPSTMTSTVSEGIRRPFSSFGRLTLQRPRPARFSPSVPIDPAPKEQTESVVANDPALFPPRDDRRMVARDALPNLVRDRSLRVRSDGRDRRNPKSSREDDLGEGFEGQVRRGSNRRDREGD